MKKMILTLIVLMMVPITYTASSLEITTFIWDESQDEVGDENYYYISQLTNKTLEERTYYNESDILSNGTGLGFIFNDFGNEESLYISITVMYNDSLTPIRKYTNTDVSEVIISLEEGYYYENILFVRTTPELYTQIMFTGSYGEETVSETMYLREPSPVPAPATIYLLGSVLLFFFSRKK